MKIRTFHVKRLKAFQSRPEDTDLTKYAVRDDHFWVVKSILDFRPKSFNASSSRKTLEFKIEWEIDGSQTWESWSIARKLQALQKFIHSTQCKNKFLKRLVPINEMEEEIVTKNSTKRRIIQHGHRFLFPPHPRPPNRYNLS